MRISGILKMACIVLSLVLLIGSLGACGKNITATDNANPENDGSQRQIESKESLPAESDEEEDNLKSNGGFDKVNRKTRVQDVIDNPVFGDYGRLIFPADRTISSDLTLENVGDILTWYTHINPDKTVEIVNYLGEQSAAGEPVFYDIYTEEEKAEDPWKEDTGLFFFRGEPNGKVAVCNAGGRYPTRCFCVWKFAGNGGIISILEETNK